MIFKSGSGVMIRQNGASANAHWKFQMFKWKNVAQHEQFIYLHCRAWICTDCIKPESNHACLGDITAFRKRKRRAVSLYQDRQVRDSCFYKYFETVKKLFSKPYF